MLILKRLKWSNCFSYGNNNELTLDAAPLTQLVGANGAGKTSISLMIQEILYGKNSKNIKKQDITNNKSGEKGYSICLFFEKDGIDYSVHLTRTSNLKFKLYRGDEDISSHTSLNTYKTLAEIIGIDDFKVFCQLIYQHSTDSLDFLTATDTNRKKFLISLLQLERYTELHEHFKDKAKVISSDISSLEGAISTIESWIKNHEDMDFMKRELLEVPEIDKSLYTQIKTLEENIRDINSINRKIVTNNEYKKSLSDLDSKYYMGNAPTPPELSSNDIKNSMTVSEHVIHQIKSKLRKLNSNIDVCPECLQEVDIKQKEKMKTEENEHLEYNENVYKNLKAQYEEAFNIENEIRKFEKTKAEFIRLNQLIDNSLPCRTLDKNELMDRLQKFKHEVEEAEKHRNSIEEENRKISAHNSKVDYTKKILN